MPNSRPIELTLDLYDAAVTRSSSHCLIADAIRERYPEATAVSVDLATSRYSLAGKRYVFLTPPTAQSVLIAFDQGTLIREVRRFSLGRPIQVRECAVRRSDGKGGEIRHNPSKKVRKVDTGTGRDQRNVILHGGPDIPIEGRRDEPTNPVYPATSRNPRRFGMRRLAE